jgi:Rad3-related DNA helicase
MADKLRRALEESHARIATLETENAALKLNHRNEMAAMEKRLRQSGAVVPWAGLPDELVEKVLAKVLELLQAAGQAGGVGFFPSSATVRLVCSGWKAVHDAVVTRLVLRRETTDEVMGMLVLRFPAVVSLEYKWITGGNALTDACLRSLRSTSPGAPS